MQGGRLEVCIRELRALRREVEDTKRSEVKVSPRERSEQKNRVGGWVGWWWWNLTCLPLA